VTGFVRHGVAVLRTAFAIVTSLQGSVANLRITAAVGALAADAAIEFEDRTERDQGQEQQRRLLLGERLIHDATSRCMQAGVGNIAQPTFELQVAIVEIAEDTAEEEVLTDIPEGPLDLTLRLGSIGTAGLGQGAVMMREITERAVVNDLAVGILADHHSFHAIIEDLARHAAERFERRLVAGQHRLHRLAMGKTAPDQSGVSKHSRKQPDNSTTPGSAVKLTRNWAKST